MIHRIFGILTIAAGAIAPLVLALFMATPAQARVCHVYTGSNAAGSSSYTLHITGNRCHYRVRARAHCVYQGGATAWANGEVRTSANRTSTAHCGSLSLTIDRWGFQWQQRAGQAWNYHQNGHRIKAVRVSP